MTTGIDLIHQERARQLGEEGWTPDHDDGHTEQELLRAATCYIDATLYNGEDNEIAAINWPWDDSWFKPSDAIRNLVKAGALIAAEIDRLQRIPS